MTVAAIVLAGGRGSRLGGVHKPALTVAGRPLLTHVLTALGPAAAVVVVGPPQPTPYPVRWTVERPAGGGPVAGLAAGLAAVDPDTDLVAVLAADLVGLTEATVPRLLAVLRADPAADGVLLTDDTGRRQWLVGCWRPAALRAALPADPAGQSLGRVLGGLSVRELPALADESADIDTPADLARFTDGPSQPSHW